MDFAIYGLSIKSARKIGTAIFLCTLWPFQKLGKKLTYLAHLFLAPIKILWSIIGTYNNILMIRRHTCWFHLWILGDLSIFFSFLIPPLANLSNFLGIFLSDYAFPLLFDSFLLFLVKFQLFGCLRDSFATKISAVYPLYFTAGRWNGCSFGPPVSPPEIVLPLTRLRFVGYFLFCRPHCGFASQKCHNYALFSHFYVCFLRW